MVDTTSGQKWGPADVETLNLWLAEGRITPQSTLEDSETRERIMASQVPGLNMGAVAPGAFGAMQTPYPRAGVGGTNFNQYPPGIYFEFVGKSWDYVKQNMGMWAAATAVFYAVTMAVSIPFSILGQAMGIGLDQMNAPTGASIVAILGLQLVSWAVQGAVIMPLTAGMVCMALEQIDGKPLNIATMFKPFSNFVQNAIGGIVVMIAIILGFLCCIVPGIYLFGRLAFTNVLITENKMTASEGLNKSWEVMGPYAWAMFGLYFVASILASLGIMACCVGVLVTAPILHLTLAQQYRVLFPRQAVNSVGGL